MRHLYSLLFRLLLPLLLGRLAWRGLRAPGYRHGWGERLGFVRPPQTGGSPAVWVHAVSVGEVQAALPLLRALRGPNFRLHLVVTTATPTGAEVLCRALGDPPGYSHYYVPYDLPGAVRRFLRRVRPGLVILMETELWPNLIHYSQRAGIPLLLLNARLSASSARGYGRIPGMTREMLEKLQHIGAQQRADRCRFLALGAAPGRVTVTGNLKAEAVPPPDLAQQAAALRARWGVQRPVWVAASTHEGEEAIVLDALEQIRRQVPDVLLVLVPRHPERFAGVARLCRRRGLDTVLHSDGGGARPRTEVYVGDTMGELLLFYAAADLAFVGGSLVAVGGHNPLEPAALGVPMLFGPQLFHFRHLAHELLAAGGAHRVDGADSLAREVIAWLTQAEPRRWAGEQARRVAERNRGALAASLALIGPYLEPGEGGIGAESDTESVL